MKKAYQVAALLAAVLLLGGCGQKFEPTESTLFVTSKGVVKSAIIESFDQDYYDFEELSTEVKGRVSEYCLTSEGEPITLVSMEEGNQEVTLFMDYETAEDYRAFNDVLLFDGTYAEAKAAGYVPTELQSPEGEEVSVDSKELDHLKVIVTEESVGIQTTGKIKYISDNVTYIDKKLARALEAGAAHPAFVLYK